MNFKSFAAAVALSMVSLVNAANAQYITAETPKATVIALIEPYTTTFDQVLKHPIGVHYRAKCQDWQEGTVRPPSCGDRRGGLVKRALLGSVICPTFVQLLKEAPSDKTWAKLAQSDIDYNNKVVEACIAAGEEVKPLLQEQL